MKVTEFLVQEQSALAAEETRARDAAPDAYSAMAATFPFRCRREFLEWLGDGADLPHDSFEAILRRVASHNEVHDRGGFTPAYAQLLAERWRESHSHE